MKIVFAALAISGLGATSALASTLVAASNSAPTSLGSFAAGHYHITATGSVDLAGGSAFTLHPDGTPVTSVTYPGYSYCNPSGCDYDTFGASYGPGGVGRNLGAVLGSLTSSPSGPADYFLIGNSTNVVLASAGNIYAEVNDTFYPNNVGSFSLEVTAVPEPTMWALMLVGFGLMSTVLRRQRTTLAS